MQRPSIALGLAAALLATPASAQDDLRDTVTLKNRTVVRGRVLEPFDAKELLVVQGGKRVRIPRGEVAATDTVRDRLRDFLARRQTLPADVRWQWLTAEQAQSHGLERMARLQALAVLELDADHAQARALLGHRRTGKEWLVPRDEQWYREAQVEEYWSDWGHALVLESEHFAMRSNGGTRRTAQALLDLEALYVWWFDTYGEALRPREVLQPMEMHVWASEAKFPGWTEMRIPYFIPAPYDDTGYTFYAPGAARPKDLFGMGLQHILYRSLAYDNDVGTRKDRRCAWLELGLAQWVETVFQGPPGRARAGTPPSFSHERAQLVLQKRRYELKHLLHRHVRDSFYAAVAETTPIDWAYAHAFTTFLMEDKELRPRALEYLRQSLTEAKSDSSSVFDRVMGRPIEALEKPFAIWLARS